MFEFIKKEMGAMEVAARVHFKNGRTVYGVILDCLAGEPLPAEMRFVPNSALTDYRETEHPRYVELLRSDSVFDIDTCLR